MSSTWRSIILISRKVEMSCTRRTKSSKKKMYNSPRNSTNIGINRARVCMCLYCQVSSERCESCSRLSIADI